MELVCQDVFLLIAEQVCASYVASDWVAAVCQLARMSMVCRRWYRYLIMDGKRSENSLIWYPMYLTRHFGGRNNELPCLHSSFLLRCSTDSFSKAPYAYHLRIECYNLQCDEILHYDPLFGVKRRFYDDFRIPLMKRAITSSMRQNELGKGEQRTLSRWKYLTSRRKKVANYDPTIGAALAERERFQKTLGRCLRILGGKYDSGYRIRESDDLDRLRELSKREAYDACPLPKLRLELQEKTMSEVEQYVMRLREDQVDEAMVAFFVYRKKREGFDDWWPKVVFEAFYHILPREHNSSFYRTRN